MSSPYAGEPTPLSKDDVNARLRVEHKRAARDDRAAGTAHGIFDLQRAAVRCFEDAVVGDGIACIQGERAISIIGVDRTWASLTSVILPSPMPSWPAPEMVLSTLVRLRSAVCQR